MRKWNFTYTVLLAATLYSTSAMAQDPKLVQTYIDQHKNMAMVEQIRVGIPAAITLAQGIHETGAGTSELAVNANNHFGIKCKRSWQGKTYTYTDDRPNECFRKYDSEIESYKDHSDFLKNNPRYASLFKLSTTDYAAWAIGLRRAGYATNPQYAQKLIKLIEDYKLQEYTYAAMGNNPFSNSYDYVKSGEVVPNNDNGGNALNMPTVPPAVTPAVTPVVTTPPLKTKTSVSNSGVKVQQQEPAVKYGIPDYGKVVKVNGLRAVYGKKGESPLEYAIRNSIRYNKFLMLNELKDEPLPADMFLYLERKNFKGVRPMHMVKPGESMHIIAQMEGVQLNSLLAMNLLEEGEEALPGTTLELQRDAKVKPKTWASLNNNKKKNTSADGNNITAESDDTQNTITTIDTAMNVVPTVARKTNSPIPTNPRYVPKSQKQQDSLVTKPTVNTNPRVVTTRKSAGYVPTRRKSADTSSSVDTPKTLAPIVRTTTTTNPRYVSTKNSDEVKGNNTTIPVPVAVTTTQPVATTPPTVVPKTTVGDKNTYVETRKVIPVNKDVVQVDATDDDKQRNTKSGVIAPAKTDVVVPVAQTKPVADKPETTAPVLQAPTNNIDTPKTELDRLKSQFDRVIYTNDSKPPVKATTKTSTTPKQQVATTKKDNDPSKYYTVKKGDTAFSIAKMHNISMSNLMDWNDLDFTPIKEGMKLKVKE